MRIGDTSELEPKVVSNDPPGANFTHPLVR
jgi:hypothetical protein